jgi:hypothetical protein
VSGWEMENMSFDYCEWDESYIYENHVWRARIGKWDNVATITHVAGWLIVEGFPSYEKAENFCRQVFEFKNKVEESKYAESTDRPE